MTEGNELPRGWACARLADACHVEMGQSPPSITYNEDQKGLPFFQGKAEFCELYPTPKKWCTAPSKTARKDDILLSVRAPVGPTNLAPANCCIGRGLAALTPNDGISSRFVLYAMRCLQNRLAKKGTGTTFSAVTGKVVRDFIIPLAPSPEQRRIVAKIEELFSDLDAGVEALKRVQANLKRYRASVLKAAAEGKLTEKWRADNPPKEPASKLLERILAERHRKWEEDQLAKYEAKGKKPPKGWKDRYKEPATPDTSHLPPLPESWVWATIEQLASFSRNAITDGPFGSNLKTSHYRPDGPRVIRLENVGDGRFIDEHASISPEHYESLSRHHVEAGDLIIAMLGDVLPRACTVPDWVIPAMVKADCARFSPHRDLACSSYLNIALNASPTRVRSSKMIEGVGRPRLNLSKVKSVSVPLPPPEEQSRIVAETEDRLSIVDQDEAAIDAALSRATRLRQSILKRAFEGKLVPQDPTDEPASKLLERIQAEREAADAATKKAKAKKPKRRRRKGAGK